MELGTKEKGDKKKKQSIFGIASISLGAINIMLIASYVYWFAIWIIENEQIVKNPELIDGMKVPENIGSMLNFLIVMVIMGSFLGILGIIEKKEKLIPIIGLSINGILFLICMVKIGFWV